MLFSKAAHILLIYHRNFKLKQCFHEKCYNAFGNTVKVIRVQNNTGLLLLLLYGQKTNKKTTHFEFHRRKNQHRTTWHMTDLQDATSASKHILCKILFPEALLQQQPVAPVTCEL